MGNLGVAVRALTNWLAPKPSPVRDVVVPDAEGAVRDERRRATRCEAEMQLIASAPNGEEYTGFSRDISETGMAAVLWGNLQVGAEVRLHCRFPGAESQIAVRAIVRRQVGYRYGLQFVQNPGDDGVDRLLWIAVPMSTMDLD